MPPSAIVSAPAPRLPMFTPNRLLQLEPVPVTVTEPCEPGPLPMLAAVKVALRTVAPFAIVSVPVPKLPTLSPPLGPLVQLTPGPVNITVPVEPADNPMEPPPLFSVPPSWTVTVPVPWAPITTEPAVDQLEPAPVTVTVPCAPDRLPTVENEPANVPPAWIVSIPVPVWPTERFWALAPGLATTVEFGVTVSMFGLVVAVGIPPSQLPDMNQLEETAPVQVFCACVGRVDAAKSAIVTSNIDETNLRPARARDAAPLRGPTADRPGGSHPTLAPNQICNDSN